MTKTIDNNIDWPIKTDLENEKQNIAKMNSKGLLTKPQKRKHPKQALKQDKDKSLVKSDL